MWITEATWPPSPAMAGKLRLFGPSCHWWRYVKGTNVRQLLLKRWWNITDHLLCPPLWLHFQTRVTFFYPPPPEQPLRFLKGTPLVVMFLIWPRWECNNNSKGTFRECTLAADACVNVDVTGRITCSPPMCKHLLRRAYMYVLYCKETLVRY